MIAGLAAWLQRIEPSGAPELAAALARLLAAPEARIAFASGEVLRPATVHRLHFAGEPSPRLRSLVVKRLSLDRSHREQRAVRAWLPAVGLGAHAAPLLEVAAAERGGCVWHVYEDLGDGTLARHAAGAGPLREERIRAALALVAALHLRFVAHRLLADCRLAGVALGAGFCAAASAEAVHALTALRRLPALPSEHRPLLDRLLDRLSVLAAEGRARTDAVAVLDWPDTLQHGDLWLSNLMAPASAGAPLRLIDWERAGVGAAIYDLSCLLRQLPPRDRPWLLDAYREQVEPAGWPWPERAQLERAAESCELGRFASCLAWRVLGALELLRDGDALPGWLFDDLVEMERWFRERTALLPERGEASAA